MCNHQDCRISQVKHLFNASWQHDVPGGTSWVCRDKAQGFSPGALLKQAVEPVLGIRLRQLALHPVELGLEAPDARLRARAAVGHQRCTVPACQRQPDQLALSLGGLLRHHQRLVDFGRVMAGPQPWRPPAKPPGTCQLVELMADLFAGHTWDANTMGNARSAKR